MFRFGFHLFRQQKKADEIIVIGNRQMLVENPKTGDIVSYRESLLYLIE